jgi:hypothetical protein
MVNHLANALFDDGRDIEDECIRKNIHQANGHISRAIKDIQKCKMYLNGDISLENFQKRIKEVSSCSIEC